MGGKGDSCVLEDFLDGMAGSPGRIDLKIKKSPSFYSLPSFPYPFFRQKRFLYHIPAVLTGTPVHGASSLLAGAPFRDMRCVGKTAPLKPKTPPTAVIKAKGNSQFG